MRRSRYATRKTLALTRSNSHASLPGRNWLRSKNRHESKSSSATRCGCTTLTPRTLPVEPRAHLPDARSTRVGNHSEQAAAEITVRTGKLCVVEDVEEFTTEFDSHSLANRNSFRHPKVGIQNSRTMKEPAVGRTKASEGRGSER